MLVNVAGIIRDAMIFKITEEQWDSVIAVHLKGTFNTTRHAAAWWRENRGGKFRLINFVSGSGLFGAPAQPNYAAAKMGIVGLTYSCANALAQYGVTANCIAPVAFTRMTESLQGKSTVMNYSPDNARLSALERGAARDLPGERAERLAQRPRDPVRQRPHRPVLEPGRHPRGRDRRRLGPGHRVHGDGERLPGGDPAAEPVRTQELTGRVPLDPDLIALGQRAGALLRARRETIGVAEGAAGGLVSAALLSVPGASTFYLGGAVVYTGAALRAFVAGAVPAPPELRGASEAWALHLARSAAAKLDASWGIGEGGAAGPTGNRYGDPPGHAWVAVAGRARGDAPRPHRRRRPRRQHGGVRARRARAAGRAARRLSQGRPARRRCSRVVTRSSVEPPTPQRVPMSSARSSGFTRRMSATTARASS